MAAAAQPETAAVEMAAGTAMVAAAAGGGMAGVAGVVEGSVEAQLVMA